MLPEKQLLVNHDNLPLVCNLWIKLDTFLWGPGFVLQKTYKIRVFQTAKNLSDHNDTELYCRVNPDCVTAHHRKVQTRRDQICPLWELEWLLHAYACWQEYSHNKVLQIYFSHGPIPASVISDGVMWACLPVPACPSEILHEVLLWEKKKKKRTRCRSWHVLASLIFMRFGSELLLYLLA